MLSLLAAASPGTERAISEIPRSRVSDGGRGPGKGKHAVSGNVPVWKQIKTPGWRQVGDNIEKVGIKVCPG